MSKFKPTTFQIHLRKNRSQIKSLWRECGVPGTYEIALLTPDSPLPVAFIWVRNIGTNSNVEILNCYVEAHHRRCGLLSILINKVRCAWPTASLFTVKCNELSEPAFKKLGFKKNKDLTGYGWVLPAVQTLNKD